jgi:two-component system, response regulator RegA
MTCAASPPEKARLLLVDDNDTFRRTLGNLFARRGYCVDDAPDAAGALTMARRHPPRYAIVDLNLDGDVGLGLIPSLRAMGSDMRIVVLTGYASIATAVEAIQLGATHYLAKPAEVDEILAAFERTSGDSAIPLPPTPMSIAQLEWEHLQRVLLEHNGNISAAARALGLHRRSLQRKLKKHARW